MRVFFMDHLIKEIYDLIGSDFVLVGSRSMMHHGIDIKSRKREVDIIVIDEVVFNLLKDLGEYEISENGERTPFREKKRMFITMPNREFIDVYLDSDFPDYETKIIDNREIKIRSRDSYLNYYKNILENYDFDKYDYHGQFKEKILKYIDLLS